MTLKGYIINASKLIISFFLLYLIIRNIDITKVVSLIGSVKLNYIMAACLISLLMQIIIANRLKHLVVWQGLSFSTPQILEINLTVLFYGLLLPIKTITGGAIRLYKLSRHNKKVKESLSSIFLDRMFATISLCTVGLFFWFLDWPSKLPQYGFFILIAFIIINLMYILFFDLRIFGAFGRVFRYAQLHFFANKFEKLYQFFEQYMKIPLTFQFNIYVLSIIVHLLGVLTYFLIASALAIDVSIATIGWVRSVVILLTMLPISVSGFGVREGALILLLRPSGVQDDKAIAFSFLVFAVSLLFVGLIGGLLKIARDLRLSIP